MSRERERELWSDKEGGEEEQGRRRRRRRKDEAAVWCFTRGEPAAAAAVNRDYFTIFTTCN